MSADPQLSVRPVDLRRPPPWAWVAALLVGEWLLFSLGFDSRAVGRHWGALLYAGHVAPLLVVAAMAMLLFQGAPLRRALVDLGEETLIRARPLALLALQLICFALFVALTHAVQQSAEKPPATWLIAWLVLLAGSLVTPLLALVPASRLRPAFGLSLRAVSLGALIGALAWGAGLVTESVGSISEELWRPLSRATLEVVAVGLRALSLLAVYEPENLGIGTSTFEVEIVPVCSGYEGIGLAIVFVGTWLWTRRAGLRFPRALWLLPLAVTAVWLANAFRITALIAVGTWVSPALALGAFHSRVGWLLFSAVAIGVAALGERSRFFSRGESVPVDRAETWNPTAAYLLPLLAVLAGAMVTGLLTSGPHPFYLLQLLAGTGVLVLYRRDYAGLLRGASWQGLLGGVLVFVLWLGLERSGPEESSPRARRWWRSGRAAVSPLHRGACAGASRPAPRPSRGSERSPCRSPRNRYRR